MTDEHGDITVCAKDKTDDPVLCRNGVYVLKMCVDPKPTGKRFLAGRESTNTQAMLCNAFRATCKSTFFF